jgi:hypothetical protein
MLSSATELLQETDVSNFPELSSRPPRPWSFIGTALVAFIAYGVFALTSGLSLGVLLSLQHVPNTVSPAELDALVAQGHWYGVAIIASCPVVIAVLWIAIRIRQDSFADYLGLIWPSRAELAYALGIMAAILLAESFITSFMGHDGSSFAPDLYRTARAGGGLLIYLIAACIAGPIMEEFVVRGFMFQGWSQSFLGPVGAIVVTSAVWATMHTQYDWFGEFAVFVLGIALCYFRWRSGSTWLTVMVHSAINLVLNFGIGLSLA